MNHAYDKFISYIGDPFNFNGTLSILDNYNKTYGHDNKLRIYYVASDSHNYTSAIMFHQNVKYWRQYAVSRFDDQLDGIISCARLVYSITLTLDVQARFYVDKDPKEIKGLFTRWIKTAEYKRWLKAPDQLFPYGSITQYSHQLDLLASIPKWLEDITSSEKSVAGHIHLSPLLYYLAIGGVYNSRDNLTIEVYFKPMKEKLNSIVDLIIKYSRTRDNSKLLDDICIYLMENLINCKYAHSPDNEDIVLPLNDTGHVVSAMYDQFAYLCRDYWKEHNTPNDTPPQSMVHSPLSPLQSQMPSGHQPVPLGTEMVVTNPHLTMSPGGGIYGPESPRLRNSATATTRQKRAAREKTSPPSQPE
jgi:hypothetical protein